MRKALLIYNPSSGRKKEHRIKQVGRAVAVLRAAGVEAESAATTERGSAVAQTQDAVRAGFDTVIACGGDGTANEILNGLMLCDGCDTALGVLPFGSGNLLATDLLLPRNTEAAVQALLRYKPRELGPGLIRYQDKTGPQQRYFIVAAGVGCDADLMYRTVAEAKERYGMYAYFLEMMRMTVRGRFPLFKVEWKDEQGNCRSGEVSLVMGVRCRKFPGILGRVRLGAELVRNDYRLMLFHTSKARHFLHYFASVASGFNWKVPQVELAFSTWFRCTSLVAATAAIHSEVDGELLGTLPVEVSIESRTFRLLMPE